jgi:hypothetical protein
MHTLPIWCFKARGNLIEANDAQSDVAPVMMKSHRTENGYTPGAGRGIHFACSVCCSITEKTC